MRFNRHSDLEGRHAFLSASKSSWSNYDDDKFARTYMTALAAREGTELHELAARLIHHKVRLPRNDKTLNQYVNDAIGFRMIPEQVLAYSNNAFGTADAIHYSKNFLRIHDLKTGENEVTSFRQLEIYVAFFCLEYDIKPIELDVELRIYQNDQVKIHVPDLDDIINIVDKIVRFDRMIEDMKAEAIL